MIKRQPRDEINVMSLLIEDLKVLWDGKFEVFDEFVNKSFQFHVILFCTIYNFFSLITCLIVSHIFNYVLISNGVGPFEYNFLL